MPHDPRKSIEDMRRAAALIAQFVTGRTFEDYGLDEMLRAAVERELMIVGEAMTRLSKIAPELTDQIPERRQIIAFRNILVHGYDVVDDGVVWDVIQNHLPLLVTRFDEVLTSQKDTEATPADEVTDP